ncbi:MAG: hypothetical protein KA165_13760 [Saprospiraceae bacterium]|nr:hypothetical protein [Saprospiraceae bacterium]
MIQYRKISYCVILCSYWMISKLYGQSDTTGTGKDKFQVTWFASEQQIAPIGTKRPVAVPEEIALGRQLNNYAFTDHLSVSDEPFRHAVFYAGVNGRISVLPGYVFSLSLIGEHRGFSYGIYNSQNIRVIPQMQFSVLDTFDIGKQVFFVHGKFGHLLRVRHDGGLMMYNADTQGFDVGIRWHDFEYNYTHYGDMAASIGLNLDEYAAHRIIYHLNSRIQLSAAQIWAPDANSTGFLTHDFYSSISGIFHKSDKEEIYFQAGIRNGVSPATALGQKTAFVAGYSLKFERPSLEFKMRTEIRYYSKAFNKDRYDPSVGYRDRQTFPEGNFSGRHFIPLYRYGYSFSQWAVFTEYPGRNVWGAVIEAAIDLRLMQKIWLQAKLDVNPLFPENGEAFVWAFYEIGPKWRIRADFDIQVAITNKILNLDLHYPGFYMTRKPELSLALCKRLQNDN